MNDENNNVLSSVIALIILIGVVYMVFDFKPKTERLKEVVQELNIQKK